MARRRSDDDGCIGCLGFPLFAWAMTAYMYVVPAVSDATGIKAGPALFFAVFLVTPVAALVGLLIVFSLVSYTVGQIVDAFRRR